tara:strand:+ start:669 stop:869 length:201 start_codon:yes stop_codon:yes gene_type:complete
MNDQTRHGIDEVISENHAKKYKIDTRKKFEKWLEECPVLYANNDIPFGNDPDIVSYKFKITMRRGK